MAPQTGIDKWLRGLDDLATADPREIEERIAALRDELEVIQLKILVLEPLLARAKTRHTQGPPMGTRDETLASAPAPRPESEKAERPSTWKRDLVIRFLAEHPHQMFLPKELRAELRKRGELKTDEGTPMSLLLRRLAERRQVHVEDGRYGFLPPSSQSHLDINHRSA